MDSAKRSPMQCRIEWHVDRRAATRIPIRKSFWRRRDVTRRRVVKRVGPDCPVRLQWVWRVMSEYCGRARQVESADQETLLPLEACSSSTCEKRASEVGQSCHTGTSLHGALSLMLKRHCRRVAICSDCPKNQRRIERWPTKPESLPTGPARESPAASV